MKKEMIAELFTRFENAKAQKADHFVDTNKMIEQEARAYGKAALHNFSISQTLSAKFG